MTNAGNTSYITGPTGTGTLPCYVLNNVLYVVGVSNDVLLLQLGFSSLTFSLKVTGFTTPVVAYSSSALT